MQEDEELFFFPANACADSALPVSISGTQHALGWLCTLQIPCPPFHRRRLMAGGMEMPEMCYSSRIIRMMSVANPIGRRTRRKRGVLEAKTHTVTSGSRDGGWGAVGGKASSGMSILVTSELIAKECTNESTPRQSF